MYMFINTYDRIVKITPRTRKMIQQEQMCLAEDSALQ